MDNKAKRLTKPWRQIGHEAIYRLPDGDYAVTAHRMPLHEVRAFEIAEALNETTLLLPAELVNELVEACIAERLRRRRLPEAIFSRLRAWCLGC